MLEAILKREIIIGKTLCRTISVSVFVILMVLGAFVRIPLPFSPVPITLQTFFVLLAGALLGRRLGLTTQLSYIFLGVLGLPVFSGAGSGALYLLGPTGGYLFGFILAVLYLSRFLKEQSNLFSVFAIFCIADAILLLSGTLWLKVILGYPFVKLFSIGFMPFIPGDIIKALMAAIVYLKLRPRIKEILW